jgi:hypothetical protein
MGGRFPIRNPLGFPPVPFKGNGQSPSPHPEATASDTNWSEYDAALRQHGNLTVWFTVEAIAA